MILDLELKNILSLAEALYTMRNNMPNITKLNRFIIYH